MKRLTSAALVGLLALAIHQRVDSTTQATSKATSADEVAARQRLKKAGHTHNTDDVTKEDFMFIDSK